MESLEKCKRGIGGGKWENLGFFKRNVGSILNLNVDRLTKETRPLSEGIEIVTFLASLLWKTNTPSSGGTGLAPDYTILQKSSVRFPF